MKNLSKMMNKLRPIFVRFVLVLTVALYSSQAFCQIPKDLILKAQKAGYTQEEINTAISSGQQTQKTINTTDNNVVRTELIADSTVKTPLPNIANTVFGREIFSEKSLTFAPSYNIATPANYVLGPADEIVIDVWGSSELFIKQKISPEGTISIQGVGPISLTGLAIEEAQRRVTQKISTIMGSVKCKLSLGQIRSIKVNIVGEVMTPGTYSLPSLATLFNAIYVAGGVNSIGSLREIKVFRSNKEIAQLDVYNYLINGKSETNIRLEDNDMIIVQPYKNLASLNGKVKRERIYEMKEGETLSQLIAYAGGFTGDAYTDNVTVKRKTGRQYSIQTVDNPHFDSFVINDGDGVNVGKVISEYMNRIVITGAVWRPGEFQLSDQINTLSELIAKAEGLKGNEFGSRGQITRIKSDYTKEIIPFNVTKAANGDEDINLIKNDSIHIATVIELREDYTITGVGELNNPHTTEFRDGMTIEDVIIICGGLKESASLAKIEIVRRIKDANSTEYTKNIAEKFSFNINEDLSIAAEAERFVLHPFDEVFIRRSPGYSPQIKVGVLGEIIFPGMYGVTFVGERISDVIKRCGGFTPEAYIAGGSIKRKLSNEDYAKLESLMKVAETSNDKDSVIASSISPEMYYPIGVNIAKAIKNPGCKDDIILNDGDRIFIPNKVNTVKISGAVLYSNSVICNKTKLRPYIAKAGGYSANARKKPFVIYMNGEVAATRNILFFKKYPKIKPGCEIVVPMKPTKDRGAGWANTLGILNSSTSMAAVVASMLNLLK